MADLLDAETDSRIYNINIRKNRGYSADSCLWISSLDGSTAYDPGRKSGVIDQLSWNLSTVCDMLDVDQDRLVSTVKSMQRKERHNGRWDNPCLTCWMKQKDKERLRRFLSNEDKHHNFHYWYERT